MNFGAYSKTVVAVVAGVIGWATLVTTSPAAHISAQEWIVGGTYLVTALGVYQVTNQPPQVGP